MKKQKRIPLKHGSTRVDEDCSQATIDMLNKMCELAYEMTAKQLKQPDVIKSVCERCGKRKLAGYQCINPITQKCEL